MDNIYIESPIIPLKAEMSSPCSAVARSTLLAVNAIKKNFCYVLKQCSNIENRIHSGCLSLNTIRVDSYGMLNDSKDHVCLAFGSSSWISKLERTCAITSLVTKLAWNRPGLEAYQVSNDLLFDSAGSHTMPGNRNPRSGSFRTHPSIGLCGPSTCRQRSAYR
jgi:hypothetical protein